MFAVTIATQGVKSRQAGDLLSCLRVVFLCVRQQVSAEDQQLEAVVLGHVVPHTHRLDTAHERLSHVLRVVRSKRLHKLHYQKYHCTTKVVY